jgi:hypothetical protein
MRDGRYFGFGSEIPPVVPFFGRWQMIGAGLRGHHWHRFIMLIPFKSYTPET